MAIVGEKYMDSIAVTKRQAKRPSDYSDLLLHPVNNDPENDIACYNNWEFDHGAIQRFYVGGLLWFFRQTGMNANTLSGYRKTGIKAVKERTNWHKMPNSKNVWTQDIARPQFNTASRGLPMLFQKAAIILMTCEVAVEDGLASGEQYDDIASPEDIYGIMSVVPACWNVNDFNRSFYDELKKKETGVIDLLRDEAAQDQPAVFEHLAKGNTVTYSTAVQVKNAIDQKCAEGFSVGKVRATSGKTLGTLKATDFETVDRG